MNGQLAMAEYVRTGDTIRFVHTEVPEEFQGQGIGETLAGVALDYARAENLRVVPMCQFIDAYMRRHPDYEPLRRDVEARE
ncbi:MAG: N-acetyltransferase [Gemmatimonadota bacterium]|nr:N-acetyltransferase [Gemmatimonadota bacterium]